MQYMALSHHGREAMLQALEDMPHYLEREFLALTPEQAR